MKYYMVKLDFYDNISRTSFIAGELLTERELIKKYGYNYSDLKPCKCSPFLIIETSPKNTHKLFGVRKINNPRIVRYYREE